MQHLRQPLLQFLLRWQLEWDARFGDLAPGAQQALRQGRFRQAEGARDLGRGQATQGAQGQRHLRLGRQRGMTADEQQAQAIVPDGVRLFHHGCRQVRQHGLGIGDSPARAPYVIEARVARHGTEPGGGIGRDARLRPHFQRLAARFLQHVFRQAQVAKAPHQAGQHPAPFLAEDAFDGRNGVARHAQAVTGRTSMVPREAAGQRPAQASASSRWAQASR